MKNKPTYAGSIKNQGSQIVNPPLGQNSTKGKTVAHKGKDLRSGK